jgi:hypothetical protein
MKTRDRSETARVRCAGGSCLAVLFLLVSFGNALAEEKAAAAQPAPPAPAPATAAEQSSSASGKTKKKVQEVDLKRLEIQGKLETPASLFVLESGRSAVPQIKALDGLLGGSWIHPVDKEALDRLVVTGIEADRKE